MYVPTITKVVKCSHTNNLCFLISERSWLTLHLFLDPSHIHQHTRNSQDYVDHKCVPLQMSRHVQSHCALSNSVVIVTRTQKVWQCITMMICFVVYKSESNENLKYLCLSYYNFYGFHLTLPRTIQHRPGIWHNTTGTRSYKEIAHKHIFLR